MAERPSASSSSAAGGAGEGSTSIAVVDLGMSEAMGEGSSESEENIERSGASAQVASVIRPSRDRQLLGTGEASDGGEGSGYEEGNNGLI